MIPSRLLGPQILRGPLATVLVISAVLGAATTWAQGQQKGTVPAPRLSEAERARRIQERDRHRSLAMRLTSAARLDEAVQEAEAALTIERELLGALSEDAARSLGMLAILHDARGDWVASRKALNPDYSHACSHWIFCSLVAWLRTVGTIEARTAPFPL